MQARLAGGGKSPLVKVQASFFLPLPPQRGPNPHEVDGREEILHFLTKYLSKNL